MYYFGFSPKSIYQLSPFIFNHAQDVLANFSISILFQTPLQINCLQSVTTWVSSPNPHLLSLPSVLLLIPAVIFTTLFHSVSPLTPTLLFKGPCFPLGNSNIKLNLTFLSQISYFEPAHTLQILPFPACGSDLSWPVLSFS